MIRFAVAFAALMMAAPVHASDLVMQEVLQQQPLSDAPEMSVRITRVTIQPGGQIAPHIHAGDEHAVVLKGGSVETADGTQTEFADGMVMFFSAGDVHGGVKNVGETDIEILTTHVVNVLEPFSSPAE
jgi:quercetin dioxygenase-like cupin family protein